MVAVGGRSGGEGTDLDQVVGEDAVSGPDPGAFGAVDAGAVPAVAAFEVADAAFAAGSPFDGAAERLSVFFGAPRLRRFAFAWDHDGAHAKTVQGVIDGLLAVAAVGGNGPWDALGAFDDPFDGGRQLRCVGRIALLHSVIHDDAVIVVDYLGLVPELDRAPEAALGDRAGIAVMQADPPARPVRGEPGDPLAGLCDDLAGRGEQVGQVVNRAGQPPASTPRRRLVTTAFAPLSRRGAGAAQRPFGVNQQPVRLVGGGGGQLGELTGDAHDGGLGVVATGRRTQPQFRPDRMRAFTRRTRPVPNRGARRTAGGPDATRGRADLPHRLGQQARIGRIGRGRAR